MATSDTDTTQPQDEDRRRGVSWLPWVVLAVIVLVVVWLLRGYAFGPDVEPGAVRSETTTIDVTDVEKPEAEPDSAEPAAEETETPVVPDVVGLFEDSARDTLERAGYKISVTRVYSTSEPIDMVFEQVPDAFEEAPAGSVVAVLISIGPAPVNTVKVPDMVGMKIDDALAKAESRGLDPKLMIQPKRESPGRVYEQSPDPGTLLPKGSKVFLLAGQRN